MGNSMVLIILKVRKRVRFHMAGDGRPAGYLFLRVKVTGEGGKQGLPLLDPDANLPIYYCEFPGAPWSQRNFAEIGVQHPGVF